MWLNFYTKNISWLAGWSLTEIILSVLYIWWFVIFYNRYSFWKAIGLTVFVLFIFLNLIPRLTSPLFPGFHPGEVDCYPGTITFIAALSKIHYETPIVMLVGVLLELGALGIMLHQVIRTIIERNKVAN